MRQTRAAVSQRSTDAQRIEQLLDNDLDLASENARATDHTQKTFPHHVTPSISCLPHRSIPLCSRTTILLTQRLTIDPLRRSRYHHPAGRHNERMYRVGCHHPGEGHRRTDIPVERGRRRRSRGSWRAMDGKPPPEGIGGPAGEARSSGIGGEAALSRASGTEFFRRASRRARTAVMSVATQRDSERLGHPRSDLDRRPATCWLALSPTLSRRTDLRRGTWPRMRRSNVGSSGIRTS